MTPNTTSAGATHSPSTLRKMSFPEEKVSAVSKRLASWSRVGGHIKNRVGEFWNGEKGWDFCHHFCLGRDQTHLFLLRALLPPPSPRLDMNDETSLLKIPEVQPSGRTARNNISSIAALGVRVSYSTFLGYSFGAPKTTLEDGSTLSRWLVKEVTSTIYN